LKFRSARASDHLSRLSLFVMALGVAALMAAGVLFGLSATGILGNGGVGSGPGTVTGFGDILTPIPATVPPEQPTPDTSPIQRLLIPAAKVDANIIVLGLDDNNQMPAPDNAWDVAWYNFSSRPGSGGNAVFSGHVDYHDVGAAVFWNLRDLQKGDLIQVRLQDGMVYEYSVDALSCMPADTAPISMIVGPTLSEVVTLITCCGTFDSTTRQYDKRLVVRADRIYPEAAAPTPMATPAPN
jgi:LPXTG-site transpeptidase (sortase) family protein